MKIGYARVSTRHQSLDAQLKILSDASCDKIFSEKVSARKQREQLRQVLSMLREDDVLIVSSLDRLGRSLEEIVLIIKEIEDKKASIISITQNINTKDAFGGFMLKVLALFGEIELRLQEDRRLSAKEAGRMGGRPKGLGGKAKNDADIVSSLYQERKEDGGYQYSITDITKKVNISRQTAYNYLRYKNIEINRR